ncbi:MAG: hypothetical protein M9949_04940 [Candidatus Kapabacteria bacterium]|nr:hypothetical protein [Candidatus Kapabacteria bacterium]
MSEQINSVKVTGDECFVFVYAKDGIIEVRSIAESKRLHDQLISDGWVHTKTLDACVYLEYLHNECECEDVDLIDAMMSLTKPENQ